MFAILALLLLDQPMRLPSGKQVEYSVITNAQCREEILVELVNRELNRLKYKSVAEWFACLEKLVPECKVAQSDLEVIAEAKATRDLLVQNDGKINEIYLRKAGTGARGKLGDTISVAGHYTRDTWQVLASVLVATVDCLIAKFAK